MKLLEQIGLGVCDMIESHLPVEVEGGAEYDQLCKAVGYGSKWDPAAHPLARWLQRNEVVVYPQDAIDRYVMNMAKENKWVRATVERSPMRATDKDTWRSESVYDAAIPIEVLRLSAALVSEFKAEVRFNILHVVEDKDPFLEVEHTKSREKFVVAHWNEPGFSINK